MLGRRGACERRVAACAQRVIHPSSSHRLGSKCRGRWGRGIDPEAGTGRRCEIGSGEVWCGASDGGAVRSGGDGLICWVICWGERGGGEGDVVLGDVAGRALGLFPVNVGGPRRFCLVTRLPHGAQVVDCKVLGRLRALGVRWRGCVCDRSMLGGLQVAVRAWTQAILMVCGPRGQVFAQWNAVR